MLREDRDFAGSAAQISALAKDITEYLAGIELAPSSQQGDVTVAYHSACSLQHGQKITLLPKELLSKNGFVVKDVPESHLCCGSAGTYNILQPDIASRLRDRKIANLATVKPDMIATARGGSDRISRGCERASGDASPARTGPWEVVQQRRRRPH